ncbi:hypothetical protein ACFX13_046958 [Malus domestica]|uniref:YGGT family protein n=1 Tax=Malus domestica TaxID=3750 RepID=A0A498J6D9_MALDO|nr:hypothetical protein DVH24_000620 [Malus domestica]
MASVMASQVIFFPISTPIKPNSKFKPFFSPTPTPTLKFNPKSNPNPIPKLSLRPICATLTTNPQTLTSQNPSQPPSPLTHLPTRTITTLFALTVAAVRSLSISLVKFGSQFGPSIGSAAGPLFFAALRDRPSGNLNTPLTVVAAGLSKWLDIYSGVLMVRVLLSWFPNIPWDRQPLSAIRDLCDPYLNLFRNIIPPIFDTLDVSPLLAFAVLGTLGSILNNSR